MANILATGISHKEHLRVFDEIIEARLSQLELEKVLIYLIDTVDASALYSLAKQFDLLGFKGWRLVSTEQERRELIKKAIELHRYKGTPYAIREAVKAVGFFDIQIIEGGGVQYNATVAHDGSVTYGSADWALFRVIIDLGTVKGITAEAIFNLVSLINEYKNVRSTLIETGFRSTIIEDSPVSEDTGQILGRMPNIVDQIKTEVLYDGQYNYDKTARHSGSTEILDFKIIQL